MKSKITKSLLIVAAVSLSACADNIDRFMNNYQGLKGKSVSALVAAIGTPDNENIVMGSKVYIWNNQSYYSSITPVTQNTTISGPGGTAYATTRSYVTEDYDLACTLKVVADKRGIIKEADYKGAPGACAKYGPGLEQLVNPAATR